MSKDRVGILAAWCLLLASIITSACVNSQPENPNTNRATSASAPTASVGAARALANNETYQLAQNMPADFQGTPTLHVVPDGIFMHAAGELKFGPLRAPAGMCFLSRAFIDPKVAREPGANGVEFAYYVTFAYKKGTFDSKSIPLAPTESSEIVVKLPADEPFLLQLVTSDREGNGKNDWAIWGNPRIAPCP